MPVVNDVGEPCAGEPHARFDGRALETEQGPKATDEVCRESHGTASPANLPVTYLPPRQRPTLHNRWSAAC